LLLLGNQLPPLRPGLLSTLIHLPSLTRSALADKMWFRYRSRQGSQVSQGDIILLIVPEFPLDFEDV
jgi:hypothetical protein